MPRDWITPCLEASLFPAPLITDPNTVMPDLANGYLGYVVDQPWLHAGGLFNGDATGKFGPASHRADVSRPTVSLSNSPPSSRTPEQTGKALDIQRAVFIKRSQPSATISIEVYFISDKHIVVTI